MKPKGQVLQRGRQPSQTAVKEMAKAQGFKARQIHPIQAMIEVFSKLQDLQQAGELDSLQVLVKKGAKRQALEAAWPSDALQPLLKEFTKGEAPEVWRPLDLGPMGDSSLVSPKPYEVLSYGINSKNMCQYVPKSCAIS